MSHDLTRHASPPCLAGEVAPDYFDPLGVDPQQAVDVARWRKAERARLLAERAALGVEGLRAAGGRLGAAVFDLIAARFRLPGLAVSGYWPIKSEPDLRGMLARLHQAGARVALPVVEVRATPLVFRPWAPGAAMERGFWNIPVPATRDTAVPQVALSPLVGWDGAGYRLGYGGGYFDRTLAALTPRPFVIGVGFEAARLPTIFPQPHDIPMDAIVTEEGLRWQAPGR